MPVYFKCKICGEKHPSPVAFTKESFEESTIFSHTFKCPKTGQATKYDLIDMFLGEKDLSS
jgi:hypothetical protein